MMKARISKSQQLIVCRLLFRTLSEIMKARKTFNIQSGGKERKRERKEREKRKKRKEGRMK